MPAAASQLGLQWQLQQQGGGGSSRVELGLGLQLAIAWPHWQAAQAHDQCICVTVCGLELELGHSQPSGPAPVRCRPRAPPCAPAATPAAHLGTYRITSLDLSYIFVQLQVPLVLPLLMGLPCPRSEENYAHRGIAVGAGVAAAIYSFNSNEGCFKQEPSGSEKERRSTATNSPPPTGSGKLN